MKCIKCGAEATKVYRPDLDITGIGMCDEHKEEISIDIMLSNMKENGWDKFEKKYLSTRKSRNTKQD